MKTFKNVYMLWSIRYKTVLDDILVCVGAGMRGVCLWYRSVGCMVRGSLVCHRRFIFNNEKILISEAPYVGNKIGY